MRFPSVLGSTTIGVIFALSIWAQDAGSPKIAKPEVPVVTAGPLNTAGVDVPAVVQPRAISAPRPTASGERAPVQAPPDPTPAAAVAPPAKKVGLPTSETPDELKSKVSIAAQHVRSNQLTEAVTLYTEVLTAKADLFTISVDRGKVYQQQKDHAKAIADFGSAIKNSPGHYEAYFRRCVSHQETGVFAQAIADCGKAIELNPDPAEYYYYRGLAHTALRTWDKAASDLAAATERNNEQPEAHLQLGRVYAEMDQLIHAMKEYTLALQQRPGYPEAYKGRSTVKAALGDLAGSKEDLSKVSR